MKLLITLTTLAAVSASALRLCNIDSVAGCKEHNMCANLQNGECTVSDDGQCGYKCVCKSGWKGDKCDERVSSWSLVMKLKAGSSEFKYDSAYWTNSATLNPSSTTAADTDNIDAKLDAFNTVEVNAFKVCYKTLSNCYEYTLPQTYNSAKALFSAGYVRLNSLDKKAWTDLYLPPGTPTWYNDFWKGNGGGNCAMQRPGINTQCHDNNWARIGYCVNLPDQSCQPHDHSDADSPIGIGLKTQNWPNNVNAPFGEYTIYGAGSSVVQQFQHQAWLFVKKNTMDFTEYIGGCCSGRNELGTSVVGASGSDNRAERIAKCKATCHDMEGCVSFEAYPGGPGRPASEAPGCWFSSSCRANERPNLDCGHDLYINNKALR